MSAWLLYLLVTISNLQNSISGSTFALVIIIAICAVVGAICYSERENNFANKSFKYAKIFMCILMFVRVLAILTPDEKQMAFIFAGSYLTQSDTAKELSKTPTKAAEYMNLYIDKQLKALEEEINPPVENKNGRRDTKPVTQDE